MDKLYEKIGLYDFWSVFFPGAVCSISLLVDYKLFVALGGIQISIIPDLPSNLSEWAVFIVAAVFTGILLQEIGRIIRKIGRITDASEGLLDDNKKVFAREEIECIKKQFIGKSIDDIETKNPESNSVIESRRLFHKLNIQMQEAGIAQKFVKLNVIQNMSISLAASMLINNLIVDAWLVYYIINQNVGSFLICLLIGVAYALLIALFINRYICFNRYWVRNIVYAALSNCGECRESVVDERRKKD